MNQIGRFFLVGSLAIKFLPVTRKNVCQADVWVMAKLTSIVLDSEKFQMLAKQYLFVWPWLNE